MLRPPKALELEIPVPNVSGAADVVVPNPPRVGAPVEAELPKPKPPKAGAAEVV